MDLSTLCAWAQELGFAQLAFCDAAPFTLERQLVDCQATLRERRQLRFEPEKDEVRTQSLLVLLYPYNPVEIEGEDQVFIDSYYLASNAAFHAAKALEERLKQAGHFAKANVSYPAKAAAVRAGLGIIGQNDLLITKAFGTRVVIILIATDIAHKGSDSDLMKESCLKCGRCYKACPSGALDERGMSHPERCLRNYMMEGIVVPEHLRKKMGKSLIGCDICQRVCPMQVSKPSVDHIRTRFDLANFMVLDEQKFSLSIARLTEQIGRNTARPQRVRAQAALIAGNSMNPAYLPVLKAWSESPFDAVREHARWAIQSMEENRKSERNS